MKMINRQNLVSKIFFLKIFFILSFGVYGQNIYIIGSDTILLMNEHHFLIKSMIR
jgi:hypothetical protein